MRSAVLSELLALVAPPACPGCRGPVPAAGGALCAACRRELPWLPAGCCPRCGLPRCRPCPARGAAFNRSWAPMAHEGPARALVHALKFGDAYDMGREMTAHMVATAPADVLDGSILIPAPAHPSRVRRRGYDQAWILAWFLHHRTGAPMSTCLRRRGRPSRQLGASRSERLAPGRIELVAGGGLPARVVVVDDVHTTGATFDACARALRAAGAEHVTCVAYARAV